MSTHQSQSRLTIHDILSKKGHEPIVSLTAYSASYAALLDEHIDLFIIGDSLGMVLYGLADTLGVSMEMMIRHGKAVSSHSNHAICVIDMPFGSYQASPAQAFTNASTLLVESGCQAVKIEGGMEMVDTVDFLTKRGICVMAHIGLKPQHVHTMGGYKYQGRTQEAQDAIIREAQAFEKAGAFSLLLEGLDQQLAKDITTLVHIPTIGIGASVHCDGQVLVTDDMLGMTERTPKFVERYASLKDTVNDAVQTYAKAVRERSFPQDKHCFGRKDS